MRDRWKDRRRTERFPMPDRNAILNSYPLGISWPHELRRALETAAADRGQSVAGFIEWLVGRALADAGLIERPNPEGP
jgi:hypothetical protein